MTTANVYGSEVKKLAASKEGNGNLPAPDAQASVSNPLCGDLVKLEICGNNLAISTLAHKTRGCLLCNASAARLAQLCKEKNGDIKQLQKIAGSLEAMLAGQNSAEGLEMFSPVTKRVSRHSCVLLPWQALIQAVAKLTNHAD